MNKPDDSKETGGEFLERLGMDGDAWAKEFMKFAPTDLDSIRTWFCNAIMAGYDRAKQETPPSVPTISDVEIQKAAKECTEWHACASADCFHEKYAECFDAVFVEGARWALDETKVFQVTAESEMPKTLKQWGKLGSQVIEQQKRIAELVTQNGELKTQIRELESKLKIATEALK